MTTAVLLAWAIFFALLLTLLSEQSGIYAIFQTLMAFFQGPALAILLCGVLWRRATGVAALVGFLAGVAFSITLFALSQEAVINRLGWKPLFQVSEPFLYFSVWAFALTLTIVVVLSLLTKPEPDVKTQYVIGYRNPGEETV